MERLQLWLPKLGRSINFSEGRRDAQRAFQEWHGELVVWLLPGLKEVVRWNDRGPILGVPAEDLDVIHVFHIGTAGAVFGLASKTIFPSMNVHGLLDAWLNPGNFDFVSYAPIPMVVPRLTADDLIEYKQRLVDFEPGPTLPFNNIGEAQGGKHVDFRWPREGLPATMAPEPEIDVFNSPRKAGVHQGQPVAIGQDGQMALRVMLRWHQPLTNLMPHLSSWDDMYSQARMRKIAEQSTVDGPGALRDATNLAKDYCSEGLTTREMAWFHTTLQEKGVGPLIFEAENFGLTLPGGLRHKRPDTSDSLNWADVDPFELLRLKEWRAMMSELVPIKRVWGMTGLFWTLLVDRLKAGLSFQTCYRCGRVLQGKRGKRYCGSKDNPDCFRERRAADMQKLRNKE